MNIAVMAPHIHGNGVTTITALIASELSARNKKVCMTHVRSQSESLFPYFCLNKTDKTNNPKQLVNLIKMGGVEKDSITNYCRSVSEDLDLFSLDTPMDDITLTEDDISKVLEFLSDGTVYDYTIFDVDENNMDKQNVKIIMEKADCIIFVLSQSSTEIRRFNDLRTAFEKKAKGKSIIYVVNKYNTYLGNVASLQAQCGEKKNAKNWHILHQNHNIQKCENQGSLKYLSKQIQLRHPDIIEVHGDVVRIVQNIFRVKAELRNRRINYRKQSC